MSTDLQFFDTHAHIHFPDYGLDAEEVWQAALKEGVSGMIAVGCRLDDSKGAIEFARGREGVWAAIGVHPHEAHEFLAQTGSKQALDVLFDNIQADKVVAVGEIGLDYYYRHSNKAEQAELLEFQLGLAEEHDLAVICHVRDAFDDFWPIFDRFSIKKAVIHSFTGVLSDVEQILQRDLYVGLNGIMTFTKQAEQLEAAKAVPLEKLVLETDAPYLTPKPFRGNICKPEHVKFTAAFLAELRGESIKQLADQTTLNAQQLFDIT